MQPEPDLSALRALTLVYQSGSISRAAGLLGVSQQAVSLKLRTLETQLRSPLLVRSTRGSQLTPTGELLLAWAEPLLSAANDYQRAVADLLLGSGGTLRIAASLTIAEHLLPGWIAAWRGSLGDAGAKVRLSAANSRAVIEAIRLGTVDLGFVETPVIPPDLKTATVGYDRIIVVANRQHSWASGSVSPARLQCTPLVLREPGSGTRQAFSRAVRELCGADPVEPAAVYETTLGVRSAVMAGVAPGALSELAVRDDISSGRLAKVAVAKLKIVRPFTAVWRGPVLPPGAADLLAEIARCRPPAAG